MDTHREREREREREPDEPKRIDFSWITIGTATAHDVRVVHQSDRGVAQTVGPRQTVTDQAEE
jgi:hypothetical protein